MMFDVDVLKPEVGVRALWMLYQRGQWSLLEDFGLQRAGTEQIFDGYAMSNVVGPRLTRVQVKELTKLTPGLEEASFQLLLSYTLKYYEPSKRKGTNENAKVLSRGSKAPVRKRSPIRPIR